MFQHQIVRYGLVGALSVSADFFVLNVAYLKLHYSLFWSVLFGFLISVIIGYGLHSRWTFQYDTRGEEFTKLTSYLFMTIIALALTEGIVFITTEKFNIYYNISKIIAVGCAILFTYMASKYWIFRK